MRILAVGAHPDDVELLCGGTLAHYAACGAQVTISVLTNGELGSPTLTRAETARLRRDEAKAAAGVIHAELIWAGEPDGFLYDGTQTRTRMIDILRRTRPDLILAHHPQDYHPDHRAASQLVSAARLLARERLVESPHAPTDRIAPLFYMDTFAGAGAPPPDLWVDVTATMSVKEAMLTCHASQNDARRERRGTDYLGLTRAHARARGAEAGVVHAEAFYAAPSHPAVSVDDVQPPADDFRLPVITSNRRNQAGRG